MYILGLAGAFCQLLVFVFLFGTGMIGLASLAFVGVNAPAIIGFESIRPLYTQAVLLCGLMVLGGLLGLWRTPMPPKSKPVS